MFIVFSTSVHISTRAFFEIVEATNRRTLVFSFFSILLHPYNIAPCSQLDPSYCKYLRRRCQAQDKPTTDISGCYSRSIACSSFGVSSISESRRSIFSVVWILYHLFPRQFRHSLFLYLDPRHRCARMVFYEPTAPANP